MNIKKTQRPSLLLEEGDRAPNLIGAGVRRGQPAEEALVGGGRVLARRPVPRHVVGVGDHQLAAVQVGAQHKRDVLHPVDDGAGLRRHLGDETAEGSGTGTTLVRRLQLQCCILK